MPDCHGTDASPAHRAITTAMEKKDGTEDVHSAFFSIFLALALAV
jgi:hypothetical protein